MNDTIKEYEINEAVLTTYHTLNALYQNFYASYPKNIEKEMVKVIGHLIEVLEPKDDKKDIDIIKFKIIKRVEYEK
ncbi:MAG: hypothetical protein GX265_01440 [Mollicutes bacterium]|nr:hypothetical protein [Mollicutes bacterium]